MKHIYEDSQSSKSSHRHVNIKFMKHFVPPATVRHMMPHLPINPESASLFIQLNSSDTCNFPSLLDVAAMAANGQSHQIQPHSELLLKRRHQLPRTLKIQNPDVC